MATLSNEGTSEEEFSAWTRDEQLAWGSFAARDPYSKIAYIFPHVDQNMEDASLFGWYTPGIHQAAVPVLTATRLPADIREPYTDLEDVLLPRLLGYVHRTLLPIQLSALPIALGMIPSRFRVFFSTDANVADAIDFLRSQERLPTLHVSTMRGSGRMPLAQLSEREIVAFTRSVLDALSKDPEWIPWVKGIRRTTAGISPRKSRKHSLAGSLHNLTTPNELALESFGWKLVRESRLSQPWQIVNVGREHLYVERICASADAVAIERGLLVEKFSPLVDYRLILAVPSLHWSHFNGWRRMVQEAPNRAMRLELKAAFKHYVQAQTYFAQFDVTGEDELTQPGIGFRALVPGQAADMKCFTAGLTALSTATLAPVIRLEPKLNQIRGDIKLLAHCDRADAHARRGWKQSRLINSLGAKMRALIDPQYLARIDAECGDEIEGMKLVSDLPLELLPTAGIPLSLRFDTSRIPPIPGNLFWQSCMRPPVELPMSAFDEVLIIRSFSRTDPLRMMFEGALEVVFGGPDAPKRVRYRFVDVESADEFVGALGTIKGAILIFDGHGTYNPEYGMGSLVVGGEPLDIWSLRPRCQFPPIVLFSACDTQPIDGSHSSVATAAFALGAQAVLGTLLPIDGRLAAMFNARLFYRLESFIPAALASRPRLTWREVISGMLRMSFVTETTLSYFKVARIQWNHEDFERVQLASNTAINSRQKDWHKKFFETLADVSGTDVAAVEEAVQSHSSFVDALKYVQLGNPEHIAIVREDATTLLARKGIAENGDQGERP